MNINIRQANLIDFPAIFLLIQEFALFQRTPEKVKTTPEQMMADQQLFNCIVAENNDKQIVGFASYFFAYYSWSGKGLYLDDLYVQKAFQGHNIGSGLLQRVVDTAKKEKCKSVRWLVAGWNDNAIAFYQKMGATIDQTDITCNLTIG